VLLAHLRHAESRHDGQRNFIEKFALHFANLRVYLALLNHAVCGHLGGVHLGHAHVCSAAFTFHHAENREMYSPTMNFLPKSLATESAIEKSDHVSITNQDSI
jgi:hypothetical protein